jgi:ATP-dependent RNA helicase SUPV3L1/SUV3
MLRVDLVERFAAHAFEARSGKRAEVVDDALAISLGLQPQSVARLMRDLGFRQAESEAKWIWRGRARPKRSDKAPLSPAFAALAELRSKRG